MKHANVAIFVPHNGCPHQCSFCNQREITGQSSQPSPEDVRRTLEKAVDDLKDNCKLSEIAFFGGSFTAIDRGYMLSLLDAAKPFVHLFMGIRLSTRPDYIDDEVLKILKSYGVTTIELGAQSMCDDVLTANNRGHNAADVVKACEKIRDYGFDLGLQMMTGLYRSDRTKDLYTADVFVKLKPRCVRIYPTIPMKNTVLGELYLSGEYKTMSLEESVSLCSELIILFEKNNIEVIRVGLHYSDTLVDNDLSGSYHPSFKELCESEIMYRTVTEKLKDGYGNDITISVNPLSVSRMTGQKRCNIIKLNNAGYKVKLEKNVGLGKYEVLIRNTGD